MWQTIFSRSVIRSAIDFHREWLRETGSDAGDARMGHTTVQDGMAIAIILVEQNLKVALELADRAVILATGRTVFEGAVSSSPWCSTMPRSMLSIATPVEFYLPMLLIGLSST